MRGKMVAACSLLALTLAACGGSKKEEAPGGSFVLHAPYGDIALGGARLPANMPAYAPLYPGAKVDSSMTTGKGGIVGFTVADPPAAVMAFYEKAAAANRLATRMNAAAGENGSQVGIFSQPDTERSLTVSVGPADNGQAGTRVGLTYGMP